MESAVTVSLTTAIVGEDTVTAVYDGLLRVVGDGVRITYTELAEDGARTSTMIALREGEMELVRRGAVSFSAIYAEGRPHTTEYRLGGMSFDAAIVTERLSILRASALPAVDCTYRLTLGGEEREFSLSLRLSPKGGKK